MFVITSEVIGLLRHEYVIDSCSFSSQTSPCNYGHRFYHVGHKLFTVDLSIFCFLIAADCFAGEKVNIQNFI